MKSFFLTVIGIIYWLTLSSQTVFLNFHQLTVEEGLSECTNDFLYMDENAFTWIGSLDGLNLYDGKEVSVYKNNMYSFRGIDVQSSFFEDGNGDIWFTTGEAINCYRKAEGKFDYYFAEKMQDSFAGVHVAFHLDKNQFLWGKVKGQLFKFDTSIEQTTSILGSFKFRHAVLDTNNFGGVRTLYGYDSGGKGVETRNLSDGYELSIPQKWFEGGNAEDSFGYVIYHIIPNIDNTSVACFLTEKGLLFFDPDCPEAYQFYVLPEGFKGVIHMEQINSQLWLVNNTTQIAQFDLKQYAFLPIKYRAYNLDEKEEIDGINRIFMGEDATLWVGVYGKGMYFANMKNQQTFSLFRRGNLSPHRVDKLFEYPNGDIWATAINGKTWIFDAENQLKDTLFLPRKFMQVQLNDNEVWAMSNRGLKSMKGEGKSSDWIPLPKDVWIFDITPFKEKYLLIGTSAGMFLFDTEKYCYKSLGDTTEFVVKILVDNQEQVWMANAADQLIVGKIHEENLFVENREAFSNMGIMNDMLLDKHRNAIWVATSKGLVKITIDSLQKTILTESDGLKNQYVQSVAIDKNNDLWLSTNRGITKFMPNDCEPSLHQFKHLSSRDGLSAEVYNSGVTLVSNAGKLWMGSTKGVDVIDPDIQDIGVAPRLAIRSLKVYGKEWKGDKSINEQENISLNYDENTLTFKLSALEYTDPKRNQFKAYLKHGSRTDSTLIESGNSITYAHLVPGNYCFEFTACNAEGIWQGNKHSLGIKIIPPFYQTWWFRTLIALIVLSFVSFISSFYYRYQLRIKQLELEKITILKEEQERIKDEVHDQMGKDLSTISLISKQVKTKAEMENALEVISKRSLSLMKNMKHLIWTLSSENSSLEDLVAKLRYDTATFLADNKIEARICTPDDILELEVASRVRHYIVLVVSELLHNILKHAEASKVEFVITTSDYLNISIIDNGKGFDTTAFSNNINSYGKSSKVKGSGHGLRSCKKRMKAIGGDIQWESVCEKGTTVSMSVKLDRLA